MEQDNDDLLLCCAAAAAVIILDEVEEKQEDLRKGKPWVGPITGSRTIHGAFYSTVPKLIDATGDDKVPSNRVGTFQNYFRLSKEEFCLVLSKVELEIKKLDTHYREAITAEERLMVTLRYLATGSSLTQLHYEWYISVASLSQIISETSRAIYNCLKDDFIKTPSSVQEWLNISTDLEEKWNFPNAIGALDGKHVMMNKPWRAGSEYHNYKGQESIILLAMCDANYSFTYVDVGAQGRASDGGVFEVSTLQASLTSNNINVPPARLLPGCKEPLPYVILADEAFPLKSHLMRPYPKRVLTDERRIFNYRLSRVRRLIENSFGILSSTWRILLRRIDLQPDKTRSIVLACCALHNLIRSSCHPPEGTVPPLPREPSNLADTIPSVEARPVRPTEAAKMVREQYCDYLNKDGAVWWQRGSVKQW
ncbi:uncharacterized protein [Watersipora subatra]|uniref:uncharacterized protein n=1 Tax=Watersipora subatra TaxID=2589382 RepID=UPI00355BEF34